MRTLCLQRRVAHALMAVFDLGVHRACLCFVCVKHIDLVSPINGRILVTRRGVLTSFICITVALQVETLCNFVLEKGACAVVIGGAGGIGSVQCITLGHGLTHASVAHPVWGTSAIREYLKTLPGYPAVTIHR